MNASKHKDKTSVEKEANGSEKMEMFDADGFLTLGETFEKKLKTFAFSSSQARSRFVLNRF